MLVSLFYPIYAFVYVYVVIWKQNPSSEKGHNQGKISYKIINKMPLNVEAWEWYYNMSMFKSLLKYLWLYQSISKKALKSHSEREWGGQWKKFSSKNA